MPEHGFSLTRIFPYKDRIQKIRVRENPYFTQCKQLKTLDLVALLAVNYCNKNNPITNVRQSPKCVSEMSMLNMFKGKETSDIRSAISRDVRIAILSVVASYYVSGLDKFTSARLIFRGRLIGHTKKIGYAKLKSVCTSDRETSRNVHFCFFS